MDRGVFKAILLAVVLVGLVILTVAIYYPFLVALLWGAVLVTATYPIYRKLVARLRGHRTLAAAAMTLCIVLCILLPFVLIAPHFIAEARVFGTEGIDEVKSVIDRKRDEEGSIPNRIDGWLKTFREDIDPAKLLAPTRTALTLARDTVQAIFSTLATLFFMLIALFYFYRDGDHAVRLARELLPLKEEDRDLVMRDLRDAVNAAVRGGLLTALVQGALGGTIVAILGLPGAIFWGAVMALASLIPLIGTALVWIPMAIFLGWQGHPWQAAILAAYGVVIIGSADNLLRPYLVGQHMRAHPLLLFFGIIGAIALFGLKGIVLGPVVVAGLTATTTLFRREFAKNG
jgi:predicted PurR-regulated permease PerM